MVMDMVLFTFIYTFVILMRFHKKDGEKSPRLFIKMNTSTFRETSKISQRFLQVLTFIFIKNNIKQHFHPYFDHESIQSDAKIKLLLIIDIKNDIRLDICISWRQLKISLCNNCIAGENDVHIHLDIITYMDS